MQRFLCFASSVVIACGAIAHESESSIGAPAHPVLNIHLTESNDAAMLNGLADRQMNLEDILGALETRAQAAENALGNHMSIVNAQIHELVNIGSSLAAAHVKGGVMKQLRARGPQREVQKLKDQLAFVTRDVQSSDKDVTPTESIKDAFDASGPEAVARQKLMNAQQNFASVGSVVESDEQKSIDSKLASAVGSPSHVGSPVPLPSPIDIASPCQLNVHACPHGWRDAGGACVASSDYVGPCASELTLAGMNEEQLLAIARYCRLELPCQ